MKKRRLRDLKWLPQSYQLVGSKVLDPVPWTHFCPFGKELLKNEYQSSTNRFFFQHLKEVFKTSDWLNIWLHIWLNILSASCSLKWVFILKAYYVLSIIFQIERKVVVVINLPGHREAAPNSAGCSFPLDSLEERELAFWWSSPQPQTPPPPHPTCCLLLWPLGPVVRHLRWEIKVHAENELHGEKACFLKSMYWTQDKK